ncbi:MAG: hypothetical protein COA83_11770 [Methylophaga sp.]|nr:MAG: hypothetical protein COA83_11770 [Methylophaga sp.]
MQYDDLKSQRKNNTAWRLLTSPHAPLIASFLYHVFIQQNQRSLPFDIVTSKLDDMLFHLNQLEGESTYPKAALRYLDDWSGGSNAFLRKYYEKGNDIPQLDLTPGVEKAIEWLQTLQPRQFIGTESRLLTLYRLLKEIVQNTEKDTEVRIAELEKQKHDIDTKIAQIRSGVVEDFDSTRIKERWFEAEDVARKLLSDFRQVEYNFRSLDREVREKITLSDKNKGDLLDEIFDQQDYIHDSEQGKSFSAFWEFLMSTNRQEELENLTETALKQDALKNIDDASFLRYIGYALLDAGQKVYQTNAQLVEQLRKYLADQAWLENKRILEIIGGIEKSTLAANKQLAQQTMQTLPRKFFPVDQAKVAVHLLMEQKLFSPNHKVKLSNNKIEEMDADIDISVLFDQHWVDEELLNKNIHRLLQDRPQISLKEVLQKHPLEKGLSELVSYLNIAGKRQHTIIDEAEMEQLNIQTSDAKHAAHDLLHVSHRVAHIPRIVFTR